MALIKCPKCGKEISDKAKECVGCGWKVNLSVLNEEDDFSNSKLDVMDSKIDMSHIEGERKKMLKEAELEIEKMKENARQEVKSMNESAKIAATQKQKKLELEYKEREKELAQQKASLEKSQKELERAKKEQSSEPQYTMTTEKKAVLPSVNILFVLIPIVFMICFMILVWKRLDKFSMKIENMASNGQTEFEIPVNEIENISDENPDAIIEGKSQGESDEKTISDTGEENIKKQEVKKENNTDGIVEATTDEGNDSRIEVTYDSCKTGRYTELVFTIKNVSNENMIVSVNSYQYINDVAVKNFGTIEYKSEIPAGKATIVNYTFDRKDVSSDDINKIEFGCKSSNGTDAETENYFLFDNLDINIR